MKRRMISLILLLSVLASCAPVHVFGLSAEASSGTVYNPLYPIPASYGAAEEERPPEGISAETRAAVYVSPKTAADQLRQAMVERRSTVTLYIQLDGYWNWGEYRNWFVSDFFPMAYSQELARCPYDGDYLEWSWKRYDWRIDSRYGNQYAFYVELEYYTSAENEAALARGVTQLAGTLGLERLEPLDAYAAIYDYITSHVTYDYYTLSRVTSGQADPEDYYIFTAYGTLFQGMAVCQGYATLYYALCWEAGLPVRILTSRDHAWNIVYLKDIWYEIDCTWDSATNSGRDWFLRGSVSFEISASHTKDAEFRTDAFQAAYPISRYDYDPDSPYNDVGRGSAHYADILRATEMSLFNGTGTYTFSPDQKINRAMLVTVLWRLSGSPPAGGGAFADVLPGKYYEEAVAWAAENGIVNGVGDNRFDPGGDATREQLVTILYRYAGYRDSALPDMPWMISALLDFQDADQVADWAVESMSWAVDAGIMNGTSASTLSPKASATREQLASLLIRLIDYGEY